MLRISLVWKDPVYLEISHEWFLNAACIWQHLRLRYGMIRGPLLFLKFNHYIGDEKKLKFNQTIKNKVFVTF